MDNENRFFYANSVEIAVSPYEIALKFMRQGTPEASALKSGEVSKPVVPVIIGSSVIAMSPSHAKAMLPALFNAVMQYEEGLSEIPLEPGVKKLFNDTFAPILKK